MQSRWLLTASMEHIWTYLGNDAYCLQCGNEKDQITEEESCTGPLAESDDSSSHPNGN